MKIHPKLAGLLWMGLPVNAFYMNRASRAKFAKAPSAFEDVPVVVEETLSTDEMEQWLSNIMNRAKQEPILAQFEKDQSKTAMPLMEAVKVAIHNSTHDDPVYLSSVRETASHAFTETVPFFPLKEALFASGADDDEADKLDWFKCFSNFAKVHDTLVVAGEGSTSPCLQCHAYQKIILGIDGSQLIRIVPPLTQQPNDAIRACASPTYMESAYGFPVSTGFHTKHDLFRFRHRDVDWELDQMKTHGQEEYRNRFDNHFQHWAEDPTMFIPSTPLQGQDMDKFHHGMWHSTVILPGDMVVIPPGWWYQTYNVEPSVSIASQRCGGSAMATKFIHHALETSGVDRTLRLNQDDGHSEEEAMTIVSGLFEVLEEHYSKSKKNAY
ncbi:Alpha beta hydrolase [Seminavis robusta]|uniref:Alpha beta hydrolase n=1 Tax=Seminavis robusta TaxID=568900 RepID=A0A9N8EYU0_9STRA|nr:Alpha beta hydrolase [Seminavis robusta]|eukprot:Sro2943_g340750.1 Alpha beta hydrolase (382) ;mRNA; r:8627-9772